MPRYIPTEVLAQLHQHLDLLPLPQQRMVLVLLETGLRISEVCHLDFDCISQDTQGDWWLKAYSFKMKTTANKPISRPLATVVQAQQAYIRQHLPADYAYLFCANQRAAGRKDKVLDGQFRPNPKPPLRTSVARALNLLAAEKNICNAAGQRWHFQPHQFRHTVGTTQINNGVPQHIVQRYLGHRSPTMTAVYAHIHDATLKQEIAQFYRKTVNMAGKVIAPEHPELETTDLQWFKRNILAQALPNGACALPTLAGTCPHANACLTCAHFRTTTEFLDQHQAHLHQTEQLIEQAQAKGWARQVEMNQQIAANLRSLIASLQEESK
ncbi:tyrosine-type recombinase/integrase [Stenomitos frigidus]|uniref:tyrosine-type recombinase/integrase n=1 Tax=Stenomitos frigidus TaxID=1886765 RepID=UPI0015E6973D|nr:tyrosine-type recombinase/integrase [Stenomitos frigidus]